VITGFEPRIVWELHSSGFFPSE